MLGEGCRIGFSCAIGHDPQVKGNEGPFGGTRIGDRNAFREFSQVHRSMYPGKETVVGDDNYFMATSHVAHDCCVGNNIIMANNSQLAGHVTVGDRVFISANVAIHQFARIGELAMLGGLSAIQSDVPPFCMCVGIRPRKLEGLNVVGMRRAGVPVEARRALHEAYRILFRGNAPLRERMNRVESTAPEVQRVLEFVQASERGVIGFGLLSRDA